MNKKTDKAKKTGKGKYEMNLAEFPVTVLSKRVSKGKKTIKYSDWIVGKNGERKLREWTVAGSEEWGLPVGSALKTLFGVMQIWKENNFKNKTIPIGSRYNLLKIMGEPTTKNYYTKLERDLKCLVGITIDAKNAFWDKETGAYVNETFHLFERCRLYDQTPKDTKTTQQKLPLAYIKASDTFYNAVKRGNILTIDSKFFRKLRAPTEQRLALYLTKMLKRQSIHKRDIFKLAEQLPIYGKYPSDIKKTLDKALKSLINNGFSLLESYYYEKSSNSKSENIVFVRAKQKPNEPRKKVEGYKVQALVEDMLNVLGDVKSRAFYAKIAKLCPQGMIYRALSETKQDYSDSSIRKSRGAIFTEKIKRYAKEAGIDLRLSPSKKDPLTKKEKEGIKEVEKAFGGFIRFIDKDENEEV